MRKILHKLKRIYYSYINLKKYYNKKNIDIGKQNRLDTKGDFDFDKKSCVKIGRDLKIRNNVSIRCRANAILKIGDRVYLNNNCIITCRKKIIIGDDVSFGPNVAVFDHDHDYTSLNRKKDFICDDIVIGNNVWIGANAVILRGTTIGDNSVIAAGAIVKGKVPSNTIYINKENQKEIRCK